MIREWAKRRYIEADYRYLHDKRVWWFLPEIVAKSRRKREFWRWLSGGGA